VAALFGTRLNHHVWLCLSLLDVLLLLLQLWRCSCMSAEALLLPSC
jgi:hypothetical protein